ncbi:hypothetical protein [Rhodococcus erythropolis]|uniref:hypothetical protein n=1 Tax=Rhodococcus erythropolis TaxID=1833 RepID=UPI00366ECBA0
MSNESGSGYLRGWPEIEDRADAEWEVLARSVIEESGVPDGDVASMLLALKSSAARERALREEYLRGWSVVEEEAYAMSGRRE